MKSDVPRMVLWMFEGPRRPWWLTPLAWAVAIMGLMSDLWPWCLAALSVLTWWMFVRFAERAFWLKVAATDDLGVCPACQYPLRYRCRVCPECGTDPVEVVRKARRMTRELDRDEGE